MANLSEEEKTKLLQVSPEEQIEFYTTVTKWKLDEYWRLYVKRNINGEFDENIPECKEIISELHDMKLKIQELRQNLYSDLGEKNINSD